MTADSAGGTLRPGGMAEDTELRALERAVAAAPADARARTAYVTALLRVGRPAAAADAALAHELGDGDYADLVALHDDAWAADLARLEPAFAIGGPMVIDHLAGAGGADHPCLAWLDANVGTLTLASLESGAVLRRRGRTGLFAFADRSGFCSDWRQGHVVEVDLATGRRVATSPSRHPGVVDVSPSGDRILAPTGGTRVLIQRWPTLEPVLDVPGETPFVHWSSERVAILPSLVSPRFVIVGLRDGSTRTVDAGHRTEREGYGLTWSDSGERLFEWGSRAIHLHDVAAGTSVELFRGELRRASPREDSLKGLPLSADGRRVAFEFGQRAHRIVLARDGRVLRHDVGPEGQVSLQHSEADLVVTRSPPALRRLDGRVVRELPADATPFTWTPDGCGLVLGRPAGANGEVALELWRPPR